MLRPQGFSVWEIRLGTSRREFLKSKEIISSLEHDFATLWRREREAFAVEIPLTGNARD